MRDIYIFHFLMQMSSQKNENGLFAGYDSIHTSTIVHAQIANYIASPVAFRVWPNRTCMVQDDIFKEISKNYCT